MNIMTNVFKSKNFIIYLRIKYIYIYIYYIYLVKMMLNHFSYIMVKWPYDKVQVQRFILSTIIGLISFGIFKGHLKYEEQVIKYLFRITKLLHTCIITD